MKTKLVILLLVAVAAVGCIKETIETPVEDDSRVSFATLFTRGTAINDASGIASTGFSVWGYSYFSTWAGTTPAQRTTVFNGDNVNSSDNGLTWSYGTPKDWPIGQKMSFFAYAPTGSANNISYDANGVPIIGFAVNDTPVQQTDLLIATPMSDRQGPDPVPVIFDHALSRIRFSALKIAGITDEISITKIELKNIYYSGTTPLQSPISWTLNTSATKDYTLTPNTILTTNDQILPTDDQLVELDTELFLMPQQLQRATNKPELSVTFKVFGTELTRVLPNFPADEWLPGQTYTYQLLLDGLDTAPTVNTTVTHTYSSVGNYSAAIPKGATTVTGKAWGGGGGGGSVWRRAFDNARAAGGGGGGAYVERNNFESGFTANIIVGAGGARAESDPYDSVGGSGNPSSISCGSYTIVANGGSGGYSKKEDGNGNGGAGGTASGGTVNLSGSAGGAGSTSNKKAGDGGNSPNGGGTQTGPSYGATGSKGIIGNLPGGGGTGAACPWSGVTNDFPGGPGADGRAILSYNFALRIVGFTEYDIGDAIQLNVINPDASASYTWKRDGVVVGTGPTLNISNVTAVDTGAYTVETSYTYSGGAVVVSGGGTASGTTVTFTSGELNVVVL